MTAILDRTRNYGDRNGTVSDPMLIDKVGAVPANTEAEKSAVRELIDRRFPADGMARRDLYSAILGESV